MGACFNTFTIKNDDNHGLQDAFAEKRKNDAYEYGHNPYSGSFATLEYLTIESGEPVKDQEVASDIASNQSQKWENAHAVRFHHQKADGTSEVMVLVGGWCAE